MESVDGTTPSTATRTAHNRRSSEARERRLERERARQRQQLAVSYCKILQPFCIVITTQISTIYLHKLAANVQDPSIHTGQFKSIRIPAAIISWINKYTANNL